MDKVLAAKIVHAEASVLNYPGKVAVAQCIQDNDYNQAAFTTPSDIFGAEDYSAVTNVFDGVARRYVNAKLLQFRSFSKYSNGKYEPEWNKIYSGVCPIPSDYMYLGEDHVTKDFGHFYFGRYEKLKDFKLLVIAGHGRNQNGTWDPGALGTNVQEADLTRELTRLVKKACDANHLPCDMITDTNMFSYFKSGKSYDFTPYNYVLEIHFNASLSSSVPKDGKMTGSMVFIDQSEKCHSVEDKILQNLYDIGSTKAWDGVVTTQRNYPSGLLVQSKVREQGISHAVLETCFITDADDVAWYMEKKELIATKIVQGIIDGFGLAKEFPNRVYCGEGIATGEALETMNVRTGPSTLYKKLSVLLQGELVEVLQKLPNGWMKIVWPGSDTGYAYVSNVNGKYFKFR